MIRPTSFSPDLDRARQCLAARGAANRGSRLSRLDRRLLFADPLLEFIGSPDVHDDGHEAVVAAAQRRTLAAINALLAGVDPEPQFIDEARNDGALGAEVGNPPGVNDILGGQQQSNFGTAGNHQGLVDLQQVIGHCFGIDTGVQLARKIGIPGKGRKEIDALGGIHVLVFPFPLIAGHTNRQFGIAGIFDLEDDLRRRDRHHDQDHRRDDGPNDFHLGAVRQGGIGDGPLGVAKFQQRINHRAEYQHCDADTDPENLHMQTVDVAA